MRHALTALSFLVVACRGGYTQEELDAAVESAVAEVMAKAATTTTPEVHVFDTMVDAMFQNVVAIAESERNAPQACKDNGSCGLPNAEGRVSEGLTSGTIDRREQHGLEASCTYHPDDGLSIVIERRCPARIM